MNRKKITTIVLVVSFFVFKLWLNSFLMAQNGDTYNFFKIAYSIKNRESIITEKRMPVFPLLLSLFDEENFAYYGQVIVNIFYLGSIVLFFHNLNYYLKQEKWKIFGTILFATNMIIVDNSFYIMSDSLFTFLFLLFLYIYNSANRKITTKSITLLSIVSILAMYTRPEGFLFIIILGLQILKSRNFRNILLYGFYFVGSLIPLIFKNITINRLGINYGYLNDKAGLNINVKNLYMGISLILFGMGGTWILPQLYLIQTKSNKILKKITTLESISFVLFSLLLIFWGPYIRLYSIPILLLIIFFTKKWENTNKKTINLYLYSVLVIISIALYIISAQIFDQRDLGMFKLAKAITLLSSLIITLCIYLYYKKRTFKYAVIFGSFIVFINLTVFIERFVSTRYKYYTIVQASEFYKENLSYYGLLAYSDESGVEKWHLRDYAPKYYPPNTVIKTWISENNIKYFLLTEEMGDNSISEKELKKYLENFPVIVSYKSPGYGGYSEIFVIR